MISHFVTCGWALLRFIRHSSGQSEANENWHSCYGSYSLANRSLPDKIVLLRRRSSTYFPFLKELWTLSDYRIKFSSLLYRFLVLYVPSSVFVFRFILSFGVDSC